MLTKISHTIEYISGINAIGRLLCSVYPPYKRDNTNKKLGYVVYPGISCIAKMTADNDTVWRTDILSLCKMIYLKKIRLRENTNDYKLKTQVKMRN